MKTIGTIALALAAALAVSACDPYTAEKTGPGQVLTVFTSSAPAVSTDIPTIEGVRSGNAWTISGAFSTGGVSPVVWVRFDKLLDGFSIQSTAQSCVPAASLGLTVTETTSGFNPADPANACGAGTDRATLPMVWYACYVPNSAVSTEGAGVVFYQGCNDISSTGNSTTLGDWNSNSVMSEGANYHITANVKDKQGRSYPLDITVLTLGPANTIALGAATATSQVLTWDAVAFDATYDVQRAPNVVTAGADGAGTYANLAGATGLTALTFTDTTVASGTKYWYRIRKHQTNGATQFSNEIEATIP